MICPLKFNDKTLDADGALLEGACQCEREDCSLWEAFTGTCALLTQSFLKGRKQSIEEQ